jgi:hypothetical protein
MFWNIQSPTAPGREVGVEQHGPIRPGDHGVGLPMRTQGRLGVDQVDLPHVPVVRVAGAQEEPDGRVVDLEVDLGDVVSPLVRFARS